MIFVSVGTNEARFDRLLHALADLPLEEKLLIQHGHSVRVERADAELVDFLSFEGMVEAVRAARVVVTHAGVGSVLVALANGKCPVVVPRRKAFGEAVDDHQLQLGRRFAESGLVTLVEDTAGLSDAIARDQRPAPIVPTTSSLAADLSAFLTTAIPRVATLMTPVPARADSIGSRVLQGIAWKASSQVILQITRMVVALLLARLLTPHDWGLAGMVILFAGFTIVFTDNALGTALIQRRDVRDEDKSTVFWFSAAVGLALAVVGVLVAAPLADFYDEPDVRWLFVAFSVGFIVNALGTTQMALLVREMQFRRLELRQMAATIVGAVIAISIALAGLGAWAIVGQLLGEAVTSTVLLWLLTPWRPSFVFSTASFRRLGGFAGNVFAQNIVWQSARSLSGILIARVLGAAALGMYTLATTVILTPFVRIAAPLQQVFLPAFSERATSPSDQDSTEASRALPDDVLREDIAGESAQAVEAGGREDERRSPGASAARAAPSR